MHLERFLLDVILLVQLYLVMDSFESHVAFARRRVWGSTFLPIWEARPPLRTFDIETRSCARPSGVVVVREIALEGVEDTTPHRAETLTTFRSKRAITDRSWESMLNSQRVAAIRKWSGLLVNNLKHFQLGRQWDRLTPLGHSICEGLKHVFAGRATGTLHNRAGPMLRYKHWCDAHHLVAIPLEEKVVYQYMCSEAGTAAPTYLRSFLVAVRFCHHLLDLDGCSTVLESRRIEGCAKEQFLLKRKTMRKDPLTVEMMAKLEAITGDGRFRARDRVAAGFFLLCAYCRGRYSDIQNLESVVLDEGVGSNEPSGYIEGRVRRTKSAYTTELKTMLLPMVAPRLGVSGIDWFSNWQRACIEAGKPKGDGVPMLPIPTHNGWARNCLGPGEAADWLRQLLRAAGIDQDQLSNVGTHSLKTTCLSWAAKYGAPIDVRRHLGYHMASSEKMTLLYSRDAAAAPLRVLEGILLDIRGLKFQPDNTRSGYFVMDAAGHEGRDPPEPSAETLSDSSDSEDSQDDEDAHIGHETTEKAVDHVVGTWNEIAGPDDASFGDDAPLFRNKFTRYIHVTAEGSELKFKCGRDINDKYIQLDTRPKFMSPQCSQCFRSRT